jgi:YfiH family protein
LKRRSEAGIDWFQADLPGATVCFTTRRGGVSAAPYDSLNLGVITGDERSAVLENRKRTSRAIGIDGEQIRMGLQVHGSKILRHDDPAEGGHFLDPIEAPPEADGHVTDARGVPMLVVVADCLPVAVRGPGGLAMLHCGWRGLAGTLIEDSVAMVQGDTAVIGPGIGPCCFEVGDEVQDAFADLGDGVFEGRMCDLTEVARRLLGRSGVSGIEVAGMCTCCNGTDFFSHRRDAEVTGRQAGIAWID